MEVKVTNKDTGKVVIDGTLKTNSRGFIDIWLPRNETYSINVKYGSKTLNQTITTFKNDPTCLTTPMKLQ